MKTIYKNLAICNTFFSNFLRLKTSEITSFSFKKLKDSIFGDISPVKKKGYLLQRRIESGDFYIYIEDWRL